MPRMIDATEAELERAAAVAEARALSVEHWAYAVAGLVAILGAIAMHWLLSIPLAIVAYQLTVRPYYKTSKAADEALERYRASMPEPSTYY